MHVEPAVLLLPSTGLVPGLVLQLWRGRTGPPAGTARAVQALASYQQLRKNQPVLEELSSCFIIQHPGTRV